MRFMLLLIVASVGALAHAQFGIGMAPGMQCPYPNQPAQGAISGNDEISNLQGQLNQTRQLLEYKKQKLQKLNNRIAKGKAGMGKVLGSTAIQAIDEHARYTRNSTDYQEECSAPDRTASAGGEAVDAVYLPDEGETVASDGLTPVPAIFCHNGTKNIWRRVVGDGGRMQDRVCDFHIPARRSPPSDASRVSCANGLAAYYEAMDEKIQLETEVAELDAQMAGHERRLEQIHDEITEGTYCPHCGSQDGNLSNGGTVNWIQTGVAVLGVLGTLMQKKQQRKQEREMIEYYARLGYPPHMIPRGPQGAPPMGGPMQPPMFPGPGAFPGNPYAAPTPGFMGMQNGVYGAMPGSMGPGSFGCQGTSPYGMQNPMGNPFDPFMNSQNNPFANPYAGNPSFNPGMNNGMFNPGYGPGIMPYNNNPMFNPFNPNGTGNMWGANAPGIMPGMNGMQNPYFQNPYTFNPNAPYGNPYYNAGQAPGMAPYMGAQNPWANNPNAPGALPYPYGYPQGGGGQWGGPGGGQWGAPYIGSPISNFYTQIEQLKQQINVIQGGGYYGGGAPPILPMPVTPISTTPAPSPTPMPGSPPPPGPTPSPSPQPIQIR